MSLNPNEIEMKRTSSNTEALRSQRSSKTDQGGIDLDLHGRQSLNSAVSSLIAVKPLSCFEKLYVKFIFCYKSIDYNDPKKRYISKLLEGVYVTSIMTIITLWALYAEDFKIALTDVDSDQIFSWIAFVGFIAFLIEWILASWSTADYLFSFFFWLDFVATISLIPDIIFMSEALGIASSGDGADPSSARAGRAARAGTRAGRIVRIVRLVRIGKLSKQFFSWWEKKNGKGDEDRPNTPFMSKDHNLNDEEEDDEDYQDATKPSNLGSYLSQLITKRVIIGVLTCIFVVPFLQASQSEDLLDIEDIATFLNDMYTYSINGDITSDQFDTYLGWFKADYISSSNDLTLDKSLVYLEIDGTEKVNESSVINKLRVTETETIDVGNIRIMFDVENIKVLDAWKSIGLTTYLIFMLTILAVVFNNDTTKYVIIPINKMISSVRTLVDNPMFIGDIGPKNGEDHEFETSMLQGTIARIGKLLQLGFGQAGSEIIRQSLSTNLTANVGGKHMNAIFGFCDIRNFTDATECLQADIMKFVNEVADIVHSIVVEYNGAPNKNVGDAYLLVWSLPDDCILSEDVNNEAFVEDNNSDIVPKVQYLADNALIALIKIIIDINNKNKTLFLKYRQNENIIKRMGRDWEVRLGWGLHCGWAIEGAIGSSFKIDASYLSPNVNLAEDLEGATKFYGVPFLISEHMVNILSPFIQKNIVRQVDRVMIDGMKTAFNLYCVDIWQIHKEKLKLLHNDFITNEPYIGKYKMRRGCDNKSERKFRTDPELKIIHECLPINHKELWDKALKLYLNGKWMESKEIMEKVLKILPTDGPCKAILNYMKERDFECPQDWKGYRQHE